MDANSMVLQYATNPLDGGLKPRTSLILHKHCGTSPSSIRNTREEPDIYHTKIKAYTVDDVSSLVQTP